MAGVSEAVEPNTIEQIDPGFELPAGETRPVLLKGDYATVLFFNTDHVTYDGIEQRRATAQIEFFDCVATRFGLPDAATLPSHPLYERGLTFYGMFEVLAPTWNEELEAQHRSCLPDAPAFEFRHYVLTFHSSTFECLATDFDAQLRWQPREQVVLSYLMGLSRG